MKKQNLKIKDQSKILAEAHWSYLADLLMEHRVPDCEITVIGFHYKTAFIHGYKHGQEDALGRRV